MSQYSSNSPEVQLWFVSLFQLLCIRRSYSSTPQPTIDSTKAASFFRSQRSLLLNLIRHCLFTLADELYSKCLIPQEAYDEVCNENLNKTRRGGVLLDCIEARLAAVPADFTKVVTILESEPFLELPARQMVKDYGKLSTPVSIYITTKQNT